MKYVNVEKLKAEIERFSATEYGDNTFRDDVANGALDYVLEKIIPSLQREAEEEREKRNDEMQKISREYRDSVIKHIEAKRVLPSFQGQLLHDFKNELNTMKQILNIQIWPQTQYAIFEKVALVFAAWGGYHFHPKESLQKDERQQEQPECIYGRTFKEREKYCKFCSAVCEVRVEQEQPKGWSEDERIRKTLISIVKGACDKYGIKYKGDDINEGKLLVYLERQKEQKPAEWSEEDEAKKERLISIVKRALHGNKYPILNDNGATELITWLESFPERFNLKLKQEWSEEDNNSLEYLHELIDFGITENFFDAQTAGDMKSWINIKLKSLRSSPHWKPSEEQMEALEIVCKAHPETITGERILSLLNDLKRL